MASTFSTHRIELFSDAVFAIIITLLVLELKVPHLAHEATTNESLHALRELLPKFLGFAFSFLILAIYWVNHHNFFHSLDRANTSLVWLNNLLLFWLCFVPFPTAWIGENYHNTVAVALYATTLFLAALSFLLMTRYAYKHSLYKADMTTAAMKQRAKRSLPGVYLYGLSIILAFVNIYLALAIFVLVPVIYFTPKKA